MPASDDMNQIQQHLLREQRMRQRQQLRQLRLLNLRETRALIPVRDSFAEDKELIHEPGFNEESLDGMRQSSRARSSGRRRLPS